MDKLISKTTIRFFLIFIISGKAPKSLSLTLWPEGNIRTLKKIIDLTWDKVVEYNRVSKGNNSNKAI